MAFQKGGGMVREIFRFSHIHRISKLPLSLLITLSAIFGLALANPFATSRDLVTLFFGTILVVMGGAMLNNVQDSDIDALMERTRVRPIPMGLYSPRVVKIVSSLLMSIGFLVLTYLPNGLAVAAVGAIGIVLYNFIYTPMKRQSMFAIFPGALCGVVPPLMGWVAGGGEFFTLSCLTLVLILFVWQFPHFWLILMFRHADFRSARLPNFLDRYGEENLKRMILSWLLAFSGLLVLLSASGVIRFLSTRLLISAGSAALASAAFYLILLSSSEVPWRRLFVQLNATLGIVMMAVIAEKFFL